jgi:hypothetical protein
MCIAHATPLGLQMPFRHLETLLCVFVTSSRIRSWMCRLRSSTFSRSISAGLGSIVGRDARGRFGNRNRFA